MRFSRTASFLILSSLLLGCSSQSGSAPEAFFPVTGEAPGWNRAGAIRTFAAENLWQYIDGDAERYLQAGVQKTFTSDYRYREKIDAVADIFVMGSPDGARKVFESQPSLGSRNVALGDAARLYKASLTFRKGRYLVRLVAYQDAPELDSALLDLGRAIEKRIPPEKAK
jgi:hypothetical protein